MYNAVLSPLMFLHGFFSVEFLCADVALEGAVIPVGSLMNPKISFLSVLLATDFAGEGFLAGVGDEVPLHGGHADKLLAAHSADRKNLGGPLPVTRFIALKDVGEAGAVLDEPVSHVVLGHYHATQAAKIQVGVQCRRLDIDCRLVKVLIGGVGVGE